MGHAIILSILHEILFGMTSESIVWIVTLREYKAPNNSIRIDTHCMDSLTPAILCTRQLI